VIYWEVKLVTLKIDIKKRIGDFLLNNVKEYINHQNRIKEKDSQNN